MMSRVTELALNVPNALLIQDCLFSRGSRPPDLHQLERVLVPGAVREIVPEHGGRGLRLVHDAERHIGLGQPHQRLFDVPRGLVLRDHGLEAVDGAGVVAPIEIPAADHHFLAGELVARDLDLLFGALGILGIGIFAHHLVERGQRAFGPALVAGDVGDLVEIG